jgi:hypothetical protein
VDEHLFHRLGHCSFAITRKNDFVFSSRVEKTGACISKRTDSCEEILSARALLNGSGASWTDGSFIGKRSSISIFPTTQPQAMHSSEIGQHCSSLARKRLASHCRGASPKRPRFAAGGLGDSCPLAPTRRYADTPIRRYADTLMRRYADAPRRRSAQALAERAGDAQVDGLQLVGTHKIGAQLRGDRVLRRAALGTPVRSPRHADTPIRRYADAPRRRSDPGDGGTRDDPQRHPGQSLAASSRRATSL